MRILDNTKSLSALSIDTTNGLGNIQPLECLITEELNGLYEAEMTVLVSDEHFSDLSVGSILLLNTEKDMQMFRVYYISKPINQRCEVRLQHITYDLTKTPVKPFTSTGAVASCLALKNNVLGSTPFNIQTNISNTASNFTLDIPRSFRECLGGYEGSMLDVFRGEYEWDNLTVKMLSRRGADNGVRISYGKNLTDFKQEENIENVYDGVLGYAVVDDVTYTASSYYNKTGATNPRIKNVDFSSDYESGQVPTDAELITKETNYANNNDIEIPNVNITVSFIPLWQTEEYKNVLPLERVSLGDTVHIYFDKLNVEASARVIKTVWNCLTEKYEEIELGNAKANLNTVIDNAVDSGVNKALSDLDFDTSSIETEMNNLSRLIVNGLGLHITKDSVGRIILHNEETIAQSQYQYMISAQGFVVSDDYGQNWRSGWTTSGEAYMNSLSTIILRAMQIYGSVITFGDTNSAYITAQTYSDSSDNPLGVSFDGSGYVRFRPQEQFIVNNITSNGDLLNEFVMSSEGTYNQPYIVLKNYDYYRGNILANAIEMDAVCGTVGNDYNQLQINNYSTRTGTSWLSNQLLFQQYEYSGTLTLHNLKEGGQQEFNSLVFQTGLKASGTSYQENAINLTNYKYDSNYRANQLSFSHFNNADNSSGYTSAGISNYQMFMSGFYPANGVSLYSGNLGTVGNRIDLSNYKLSHNSYANRILMTGREINPSDSTLPNSIYIYNYDVDSTRISNSITLSKSSTRNDIQAIVKRDNVNVATFELYNNNGNVGVYMSTAGGTVVDTQYYGTGIQLNAMTGDVIISGYRLVFHDNGTGTDTILVS